MAGEQQNKRPLTPSGESNSGTSKKSKAPPAAPSSPVSGVMVKQEAQEREAAQPGRASRARAAAVEQTNTPAELPEATIRVELRLLHCAVAECNRPLKPPIFKCEAGHRLCRVCRGDAGEGHCLRCGCDTTFVHCPDVDEYLGSFKVPCPFESYGCSSAVVYHDVAAHRDACAYAPCLCAVAGCTFAASPPMLRNHLAAEHSWPVHALPGYGRVIPLRVPASESGPAHHLLAVNSDERRLFVMSVRPRGASGWAITVTCVRPSGAAEAGPRYECDLSAYGPAAPGVPGSKGDYLLMLANVASRSVASGAAAEEEMALVVPPLMLRLRGPSSKEIHLCVGIKVVNPDPAPAPPLPAVC